MSTISSRADARPTFSAIVPNFNDTSIIDEALGSLANQTDPFHEIVVVDDGSTDGRTEELAAIVARTPRAHLMQLPSNRGVAAALNAGLHGAVGDFVVLCSANDRYDARLVETCRGLLARHPDLAALTGNAIVRDDARGEIAPALRPLSSAPAAFSAEALVRACRRSTAIVAPGYAIRRKDAIALGGLDPALRWHCDWFLFAVVAFTSGYGFMPVEFSTMTVTGGPRFSDGMFDWRQERPVIQALVRRLAGHPEAAACFRRAALLPCYDLRELWCLRGPDVRWIITPLLVWRMTVHSLAYWLKALLPRPLLTRVRAWMRI